MTIEITPKLLIVVVGRGTIPLTVTQATTVQGGFVIHNSILNVLSMVFSNFPLSSAIVDSFLTF